MTFVVTGADVDDDQAVAALMEHLDAMLFRGAGVDLLSIVIDGENAIDAARRAYIKARMHVPEIVFVRLDRDLVGIPEIAERSGRTRQSIAQLIAGERRGDVPPFPQPEGVIGRARVWLWSEVSAWLKHLGIDDGLARPSREEMTEIDYRLQRGALRTLESLQQGRPAQVGTISHVFYSSAMAGLRDNLLVLFATSTHVHEWRLQLQRGFSMPRPAISGAEIAVSSDAQHDSTSNSVGIWEASQ
ncbi:helix-turn-helix transcriptional regulator [Nonomuraea jabiensis]|uniref:helix-turn-helix transcriptional regulator n=1 Tax=Nonomuraea jabiensis TaxID=882448 RepID=UPI003D703D46